MYLKTKLLIDYIQKIYINKSSGERRINDGEQQVLNICFIYE